MVALDPALRRRRIEELERACRERGLPVTVQRRAVFEAVLGRDDHPTADDVYDEVKDRLPGISRASVYRILYALAEFGLIKRICQPGSTARFDPEIDRHHHLVCLECESIIDFEAERFNDLPLPDVRAHGFEIVEYHVHFRGICARCRSKKAGSRKAAKKAKPKTKR